MFQIDNRDLTNEESSELNGFVTIRFDNAYIEEIYARYEELSSADFFQLLGEEIDPDLFERLSNDTPIHEGTIRPNVQSASREEVRQFEEAARQALEQDGEDSEHLLPYDFTTFWRIDFRALADDVSNEEIIEILESAEIIDFAYWEYRASVDLPDRAPDDEDDPSFGRRTGRGRTGSSIIETLRRATQQLPGNFRAASAPSTWFQPRAVAELAVHTVQRQFRSAVNGMLSLLNLNPFFEDQNHLSPAPVGIDALAAWNLPTGRGDNVHFVDIEMDWIPNHEDIVAQNPQHQYGVGSGVQTERDHGTAVLGVVAASSNNEGGIGVAPHLGIATNLSSVNMISVYDPLLADNVNVPDALWQAFRNNPRGSIILVEVQRGKLPVEVDPVDYSYIRALTALGYVVVEPAGNGKKLNPYKGDVDAMLHKRDNGNIRDSGAIMVGGARSAVRSDNTHRAHPRSNFGDRVNCYAWGEHVVTSGYGDLSGTGDLNNYTELFSGTSSASAIIAGAAVLLQGLVQDRRGIQWTSSEMRDALSDSSGTPSHDGSIGYMPDLASIIARYNLQ